MSSTAEIRRAGARALGKRRSFLRKAGRERANTASPLVTSPAVRAISAAYSARAAIAAAFSMGRIWLVRWRERHELAELDDRLLVDIGYRRVDAVQESRKPFWKP